MKRQNQGRRRLLQRFSLSVSKIVSSAYKTHEAGRGSHTLQKIFSTQICDAD